MSDRDSMAPSDLHRARRRFYIHTALNGVSFRLLAGNIITLYALRLGAGNTLVGAISSFMYISMLFLFLGRALIRRTGAVRLQTLFWIVRYILMIPAVMTILPSVRSHPALSLVLLVVSVIGFHAAKSIGLAGQRAILGLVSDGTNDRGTVLAKIQSINTFASALAWLLVGLVLERTSALPAYSAILGVGIVFGLCAAWALSGIPEPAGAVAATEQAFWKDVGDSLGRKGYRRLTQVLVFRNLFLGMTGPFLVVLFKRVFAHSDGNIVFVSLAGSIGVVAMAAIAGLLMDRVGAKPLFVHCSAMTSASLLILVAAPVVREGILFWAIPSVTFFLYQSGAMGADNCAQDYFLATVTARQRVNLGIFHNVTTGVAAFAGAAGGGVVLDVMTNALGLPLAGVFRLYFAIMLCGHLSVVFLVSRLPAIGAYSILNTLSVLFSPKDLRALRLAKRLGRSHSEQEEATILHRLGDSPSTVTTGDLIRKLNSPTFAVRAEALNALRDHEIDKEAEKALVAQIRNHRFTTAYIAAELAGVHRVAKAVPALREAIGSDDFMLSGEAAVALSRMADQDSLGSVVELFRGTVNPRLVIYCARALALFKARHSVPVMIEKLRRMIAPHIRDEIIIAIAETLGMGDWYYRLYSQFLENRPAGIAELRSRVRGVDQKLVQLADLVASDQESFAAALDDYLTSVPEVVDTGSGLVEAGSAATVLARYRFLVASWLAWQRMNLPDKAS